MKYAILSMCLALIVGCSSLHTGGGSGMTYNVKSYGATGDGKTIDTPAINAAIDAAASHGGGTVFFPAGTYACYSIRLKSNVALYLDQGSTILAAEIPQQGKGGGYDAPEPNSWGDVYRYQDFGHTHWHNSLIWGENLHDVSIIGPGKIDGTALSHGGLPKGWYRDPTTKPGGPNYEQWMKDHPPKTKGKKGSTSNPATTEEDSSDEYSTTQSGHYPPQKGIPSDYLPAGIGNKSISLKLCRNVIIKDVTIFKGGHFAILVTGVDNLTLDNLKIDTNRDSVDIDCCRNVRMSNCFINSPNDDGICPKSSFALGYARSTENVTITNCQVSGYEVGTYLDDTFKKKSKGTPTGRIKCGTESNGGFKNITISNCVFDYSCGLALESVDGAKIEDISISNITMRDIANSPIFIRLGARMRGPEGTPVGDVKRVNISNIVCWNVDPKYSCLITGIPDHRIEDLQISDVQIHFNGGDSVKKAATSQPSEKISTYPEPSMFGWTPSYGFFIRHAENVQMHHIQLFYDKPDVRAPFVLEDVQGIDLQHVKAQHETDVPLFKMKDVSNFSTEKVQGMDDVKKDKIDAENFDLKEAPPKSKHAQPADE